MGEANGSRTLGKAIRERRVELGWSQEALAARASVHGQELRQSDVSRLERDKVRLPRRERLELIAAALGLPLGELLVRSGWAGADAALRQAGQSTRRAEPLAPAETIDLEPSGPETPPRLRAAIDRAHELKAWSAELMRRSASAFDRVNPSTGQTTRHPAGADEQV